MEFRNQHVVPVSYLKAWADPLTPKGQDPYVWLISKDQTEEEHRAPKNVLSETDFYTVFDKDGNRNVELEKRLSRIESEFIKVRDTKLEKHLPLDGADRVALINFVSTAFSRTNLQKESQQEVWEDYQRVLAFLPSSPLKQQLVERAKALAAQPMPYFMFHFLEVLLPVMRQMQLAVYTTKTTPGFLTSDNPVLWPEVFNFASRDPESFFGIESPTLEIIMPVSPGQIVYFSKQGAGGYFQVDKNPDFLNGMNQMTIGFSENVFVSRSQRLR